MIEDNKIEFEWDEEKRLSNLEKHGLDFWDVHLVFKDKDKYEIEDTRKNYGEKRFITIGKMDNIIVTSVCHTDRNGKIRIISFRPAHKK